MIDPVYYGLDRNPIYYTETMLRINGLEYDKNQMERHRDFLINNDKDLALGLALKTRYLASIDAYIVNDEKLVKLALGNDCDAFFKELALKVDELFEQNKQKCYFDTIRQELNSYFDYGYDPKDTTTMHERLKLIRNTLEEKGEEFVKNLADAIICRYESGQVKDFKKVPKDAYHDKAKFSEYLDSFLKKMLPTQKESKLAVRTLYDNLFSNRKLGSDIELGS
jgi:hypothetical protein